MGCYAQLAQEERYQIHGLLKAGYSLSEIAEETGRHRSTVSREVRRNSGQRGYRPAQAHRFALKRRKAAVSSRITGEDWEELLSKVVFEGFRRRSSLPEFHQQIWPPRSPP